MVMYIHNPSLRKADEGLWGRGQSGLHNKIVPNALPNNNNKRTTDTYNMILSILFIGQSKKDKLIEHQVNSDNREIGKNKHVYLSLPQHYTQGNWKMYQDHVFVASD